MKKLSFYLFLCSCLFINNASSYCRWKFPQSKDCFFKDVSAEFRVAYFRPSSSKVRCIYSDGWADYQLEISKSIKPNFLQCSHFNWRIWTGVSGFSRKGASIGDHRNRTRLCLIPIYLGMKIRYNIIPPLWVYLGGAGCYSYLRIHDDSSYVHEHIHKEGWGGVIQSGINYNFTQCLFVSAFADYFFQKFHFSNEYVSYSHYIERNDLNMNGYKVGVGLGISF